jgi:hypothetical protein
MKMEQTECSEMSAYKLQMPGNYPKEAYSVLCPVISSAELIFTILSASLWNVTEILMFEGV